MTPTPTGFKRLTIDFSLARSLTVEILRLTFIPASFGIRTRKRPGRLISVVTRGPLWPVGSFTTCTTSFCFGASLSCSAPFFITS